MKPFRFADLRDFLSLPDESFGFKVGLLAGYTAGVILLDLTYYFDKACRFVTRRFRRENVQEGR